MNHDGMSMNRHAGHLPVTQNAQVSTNVMNHSSVADGSMSMFFHFKLNEVILFRWWQPESVFGFCVSCLIIVAIAYFNVFIKALRIYFDSHGVFPWNRTSREPISYDHSYRQLREVDIHSDSTSMRVSNSNPVFFSPLRLRNTCRAFVTVFTTFVDYMLMLIAMSFNVALVASVLLGYGLGILCFGEVLMGASPLTKNSEKVNVESEKTSPNSRRWVDAPCMGH
eukprot:GDKJ01017778.1.p1 GENE.GDKJ01017778.1~~GDKJ01017778.1.p1  ORF type:complete len:224 (+),score=25.51 GDKJ01017778.1:26-697(+)